MFGDDGLNEIFLVIEPLLVDSDKYKQRAGAEILSGILRGEYFLSSYNSMLSIDLNQVRNIGLQGLPTNFGDGQLADSIRSAVSSNLRPWVSGKTSFK